MNNCGACKYWRLNPKDMNIGHCHRFPPSLLLIPMRGPGGQMVPAPMPCFPAMDKSDWCGEFLAKVEL